MQNVDSPVAHDFVATFASQRQRLLHHADSILKEAPAGDSPTTRLSQMLLTSLELLKVAEEELREEQRTAAMRSMVQERRVAHLMALFNYAPICLVLTTLDTTIREANNAAAALLGWDSHALEGRRVIDMIPGEQRSGFREQLAHAVEVGNVAAWSFRLDVRRTVPAVVSASVRLIDDAAVGTRALYWSLRAA